MIIEGALQIELILGRGCIADVTLSSSRPVTASRVFRGMSPAAVLALVPRLFSVCGTAQGCAAAAALEAAQGIDSAPENAVRREMLVLMETAREHLWRLCVDAAPAAGLAPVLESAATARALVPRAHRALLFDDGWHANQSPRANSDFVAQVDALEQLLVDQIFGLPLARWCDRLTEAPRLFADDRALAGRLLHSAMQEGTSCVTAPAFLPPLDPAWLDRRLDSGDAERFIAAPTLEDGPCETTALARHWHDPALASIARDFGAGPATRWAARLLELARLPQRLGRLARHGSDALPIASSPRSGRGLAQLEAARGRLIHRVRLNDQGNVSEYQIVAPTEWNFHPDGVLRQSLRGQPVTDILEARRKAALMVQLIDPCVGFEVTVDA